MPARRKSRAASEKKKTTQLQQIAALTDANDERLHPFSELAAPWRCTERVYGNRLTISGKNGLTKDEAAQQHNSDVRRLQTPEHLLVYTDGSQREIQGQRRVGAGLVAYRDGTQVFELSMGLGDKAEVYDGEMAALAMGSAKATHHAKQDEGVKHLHFYADNTSAIEAIFDPLPKTGQALSIMFHRRIREFLDTDTSHTVEIAWCPGHKDVLGNERADALAKRGAEKTVENAGRTRANARREAKAKTIEQWKKQWEGNPKHGRFATANRISPSLKPTHHLRDLADKREVFGRVLQCRTGHGYIGEYYSQFVPSENVDCPCGEPYQTREHIIRECPLYEDQREELREASRSLYLPDILGTREGIEALSRFIEKSGAFTRTGETRVPRVAPEFEEEEREWWEDEEEDSEDEHG